MDECGVVAHSDETEIWNKHQKVIFRRSAPGGRYFFTTSVFDGANWIRSSSEHNVLVCGPNFDLAANSCQALETSPSHAELALRGRKEDATDLQGEKFAYEWDARVDTSADEPWIHFKVTVHPSRTISLDTSGFPEPGLLIDLGPLPPYERGHFEWLKTEISNPTVSCHGTPGNDFPGLYFWDTFRKSEVMMYFNMGSMNWMSSDNFRRFLQYRCSLVRDYVKRRYKVGLWASSPGAGNFPAGDQTFEYWLYQRFRQRGPSEQDAVVEMIENALPLIPSAPSWPEKATTWADFSDRCLNDSVVRDWCWVEVDGVEGFRAYVKGTPRAWQDVFPDKDFSKPSRPGDFEILDILHPLLLYSRLPPNSKWADLAENLSSTVEKLYSDSKLRGDLIDVWPYLYRQNRLWWFAFLRNDKRMLERVIADMNESIKLARNVGYVFPLFFDSATMDKSMSGMNPGNGGLYAYNMILAHAATGDPSMLDEAKAALNVVYHAPADRLFHEPIELGFGALASLAVRSISGDERYLRVMKYLLSQELRMFYWYRESSVPASRYYDTRGMVQACASMMYPAMFENVISILPWTLIFKHWRPPEAMLRTVNLQRVHNFYMFPACLPDNAKFKHEDPCEYIPFENLQLLEADEETGYVGKEIYGAGETLWMYLMFEALANTEDRDVMVLNLDCLDHDVLTKYPPEERTFLIYNPTDKPKEVPVRIPHLTGRTYAVSSCGEDRARPEGSYTREELSEGIKAKLGPRESQFLRLRPT
jgi:hypothetical protein